MVRLGMGKWLQHYAWDGHKYVCEDDFREEECLVYTIGVSTDASFEESMASIGNPTNLNCHKSRAGLPHNRATHYHLVGLLSNQSSATGCEVYAHDHTVRNFPHTKYQNIHFVKLGIGANNTREVKTLDTLLRTNEHAQKVINYLKVGIKKICTK